MFLLPSFILDVSNRVMSVAPGPNANAKFFAKDVIYIDEEVIQELSTVDYDQILADVILAGGKVVTQYNEQTVTCVVLPNRQNSVYIQVSVKKGHVVRY
jgi:hypothetical protein